MMTPSDTAHPEGEREPHDLKTWPGPFADVKAGRKPFEYRFNDRDYREGDTLRLREWSPETGDYTGETLLRRVGYILGGGQFGIPPGYVIMALDPPSRPQGACIACGRPNSDPRPWDAREPRCPDCQDADRPPALSALVRPQGEEGLWRPISEAPRDGTRVDLWVYWPENDTLDRTPDAHWNDDAGEWQLGQFHAGQFVQRPELRAWMHRPAPPAISNQGKPSS